MSADRNEPATAAEERSAAVRRVFGLDATLDHVRAVGGAAATSPMLGTPLSPREVTELERRDRVVEVIQAIESKYSGSPTYGGSWIDQQAGGILKTGVVGSTGIAGAQHVAEAQLLVPPGSIVEAVPVSFSRADLEDVYRVIAAQMRTPTPGGWALTSVGVEVPDNVVSVGVRQSALASVGASLSRRYTDRVRVYASEGYTPL